MSQETDAVDAQLDLVSCIRRYWYIHGAYTAIVKSVETYEVVSRPAPPSDARGES